MQRPSVTPLRSGHVYTLMMAGQDRLIPHYPANPMAHKMDALD
jgi:hypothetical protein